MLRVAQAAILALALIPTFAFAGDVANTMCKGFDPVKDAPRSCSDSDVPKGTCKKDSECEALAVKTENGGTTAPKQATPGEGGAGSGGGTPTVSPGNPLDTGSGTPAPASSGTTPPTSASPSSETTPPAGSLQQNPNQPLQSPEQLLQNTANQAGLLPGQSLLQQSVQSFLNPSSANSSGNNNLQNASVSDNPQFNYPGFQTSSGNSFTLSGAPDTSNVDSGQNSNTGIWSSITGFASNAWNSIGNYFSQVSSGIVASEGGNTAQLDTGQSGSATAEPPSNSEPVQQASIPATAESPAPTWGQDAAATAQTNAYAQQFADATGIGAGGPLTQLGQQINNADAQLAQDTQMYNTDAAQYESDVKALNSQVDTNNQAVAACAGTCANATQLNAQAASLNTQITAIQDQKDNLDAEAADIQSQKVSLLGMQQDYATQLQATNAAVAQASKDASVQTGVYGYNVPSSFSLNNPDLPAAPGNIVPSADSQLLTVFANSPQQADQIAQAYNGANQLYTMNQAQIAADQAKINALMGSDISPGTSPAQQIPALQSQIQLLTQENNEINTNLNAVAAGDMSKINAVTATQANASSLAQGLQAGGQDTTDWSQVKYDWNHGNYSAAIAGGFANTVGSIIGGTENTFATALGSPQNPYEGAFCPTCATIEQGGAIFNSAITLAPVAGYAVGTISEGVSGASTFFNTLSDVSQLDPLVAYREANGAFVSSLYQSAGAEGNVGSGGFMTALSAIGNSPYVQTPLNTVQSLAIAGQLYFASPAPILASPVTAAITDTGTAAANGLESLGATAFTTGDFKLASVGVSDSSGISGAGVATSPTVSMVADTAKLSIADFSNVQFVAPPIASTLSSGSLTAPATVDSVPVSTVSPSPALSVDTTPVSGTAIETSPAAVGESPSPVTSAPSQTAVPDTSAPSSQPEAVSPAAPTFSAVDAAAKFASALNPFGISSANAAEGSPVGISPAAVAAIQQQVQAGQAALNQMQPAIAALKTVVQNAPTLPADPTLLQRAQYVKALANYAASVQKSPEVQTIANAYPSLQTLTTSMTSLASNPAVSQTIKNNATSLATQVATLQKSLPGLIKSPSSAPALLDSADQLIAQAQQTLTDANTLSTQTLAPSGNPFPTSSAAPALATAPAPTAPVVTPTPTPTPARSQAVSQTLGADYVSNHNLFPSSFSSVPYTPQEIQSLTAQLYLNDLNSQVAQSLLPPRPVPYGQALPVQTDKLLSTPVSQLSDAQIVQVVNDSAAAIQKYWTNTFAANGGQYRPANMVIVNSVTKTVVQGNLNFSGSGVSSFIPTTGNVQLDLANLRIAQQDSANATGIVIAQTVAHEIGHYVARITGVDNTAIHQEIYNKLEPALASNPGYNLDVAQELEADYLSGVALRGSGLLAQGDPQILYYSVAASGDDIARVSDNVAPTSKPYTHGTAADRAGAFYQGLLTGNPLGAFQLVGFAPNWSLAGAEVPWSQVVLNLAQDNNPALALAKSDFSVQVSPVPAPTPTPTISSAPTPTPPPAPTPKPSPLPQPTPSPILTTNPAANAQVKALQSLQSQLQQAYSASQTAGQQASQVQSIAAGQTAAAAVQSVINMAEQIAQRPQISAADRAALDSLIKQTQGTKTWLKTQMDTNNFLALMSGGEAQGAKLASLTARLNTAANTALNNAINRIAPGGAQPGVANADAVPAAPSTAVHIAEFVPVAPDTAGTPASIVFVDKVNANGGTFTLAPGVSHSLIPTLAAKQIQFAAAVQAGVIPGDASLKSFIARLSPNAVKTPTASQIAQQVTDSLFANYQAASHTDSGGAFGYKDVQAAQQDGNKTLEQEVIGGMSTDFQNRLYGLLQAAQAQGIHIGINSGYRGDYRESLITEGVFASPGHSNHGGSRTGGYGTGIAADLVGVNGTSNEAAWSFVDAHDQQFGLSRPLASSNDPSHVQSVGGPRNTPVQVQNLKPYDLIDPATGKVVTTLSLPVSSVTTGPVALGNNLNTLAATTPALAALKGDGNFVVSNGYKVSVAKSDGTQTQVGSFNTQTLQVEAAAKGANIPYTRQADGTVVGSDGKQLQLQAVPRAAPSVPGTYNPASGQALVNASEVACKVVGCNGALVAQGMGGVVSIESQGDSLAPHPGSQYQGLGQLGTRETYTAISKLNSIAQSPSLSTAEQGEVQSVVAAATNAVKSGQNPNTDPVLGAWLLVGNHLAIGDLPKVSAATNDPRIAAAYLMNAQFAPVTFEGNFGPATTLSPAAATAYNQQRLGTYWPGMSVSQAAQQLAAVTSGKINAGIHFTSQFLTSGGGSGGGGGAGGGGGSGGTGGAGGAGAGAGASTDYQLVAIAADGTATPVGGLITGAAATTIAAAGGTYFFFSTDQSGTADGKVQTEVANSSTDGSGEVSVAVDKDGNILLNPDGSPKLVFDPTKTPAGTWDGNTYTIQTPPATGPWTPGGAGDPYAGQNQSPASTGQPSGSQSGQGSGQPSQPLQQPALAPLSTPQLSCTPSSIPAGTSTPITVSWSCLYGTPMASGFSTGGAQVGQSIVKSPANTTAALQFSLTCIDPAGLRQPSAAAQCSVSVAGARTNSPVKPVVTIIANPTSVASGGTSQISWSSVGTTGCEVTLPGGTQIGSTAIKGSATSPALSATTIFTALCQEPSSSATVSATTSVTVQ